jgi:hypothetical protein
MHNIARGGMKSQIIEHLGPGPLLTFRFAFC